GRCDVEFDEREGDLSGVHGEVVVVLGSSLVVGQRLQTGVLVALSGDIRVVGEYALVPRSKAVHLVANDGVGPHDGPGLRMPTKVAHVSGNGLGDDVVHGGGH